MQQVYTITRVAVKKINGNAVSLRGFDRDAHHPEQTFQWPTALMMNQKSAGTRHKHKSFFIKNRLP